LTSLKTVDVLAEIAARELHSVSQRQLAMERRDERRAE
jgi:hypothetical protein